MREATVRRSQFRALFSEVMGEERLVMQMVWAGQSNTTPPIHVHLDAHRHALAQASGALTPRAADSSSLHRAHTSH